MFRALLTTTCAVFLYGTSGATTTNNTIALSSHGTTNSTVWTWNTDGTLSILCNSDTPTVGDASWETWTRRATTQSSSAAVNILEVRGCELIDDWLKQLFEQREYQLDNRLRQVRLVNNTIGSGGVYKTRVEREFQQGLEATGEEELSTSIRETLKRVELVNLTGNSGASHFLSSLVLFSGLHSLILVDNDLVTLENVYSNFTQLTDLVLTGNRWECQKMDGFVNWYRTQHAAGIQFHRQNETKCDYVEHQIIFGSTTFDLLIESCPANCTCHLVQTMIKVDCRQRGFHSLPQHVPHTTGILHMENNRVRSLQPLTNGTNYKNLRFLYMDNNSISSINVLEGTDFFNGLNVLHISGNQLTQVPTHVLDRLLSTTYLEDVTLGRNPWNCDCKTVAPFHGLLLKHAKRFKDVEQIRCASDGTHQPNKTISKLSMSEICAVGGFAIHPLDILNVFLVVIIVLVTAKILYDYRSYHKTGQLPVGPWQYWQNFGKSKKLIVEHGFNSGAAKV